MGAPSPKEGRPWSTLQNLTRPALTGAERPRGARLRRGAAAYGVAFPALQTPILAQKIARAPRAQPHLSRRAPRAAPPSGRAPRAASNLHANPISVGRHVLLRAEGWRVTLAHGSALMCPPNGGWDE